jgi:hypothetical protein
MNIDSASKVAGAIASIVAALAAAGALAVSIDNKVRIKDVHISINSRMDQLLQERGKSSKAEGVTQERARQDAVDEKLDNKQ